MMHSVAAPHRVRAMPSLIGPPEELTRTVVWAASTAEEDTDIPASGDPHVGQDPCRYKNRWPEGQRKASMRPLERARCAWIVIIVSRPASLVDNEYIARIGYAACALNDSCVRMLVLSGAGAVHQLFVDFHER